MAVNNGLSNNKMASRIYDREDNLYKQSMIKEILDMYADEVRKAVMSGERVQITRVGTIIPELKTHIGRFNMPIFNKTEGDPPPYTKIRISRNHSIKEAMDEQLMKNMDAGIFGLDKLSFTKQQVGILKASGYIPEDYVLDDTAEAEEDPCTEQ